MRELVKVAYLKKDVKQRTKQTNREVETMYDDMSCEIPQNMLNNDPNDVANEVGVECKEENELAELEKIVCRFNDLDDAAFDVAGDYAENCKEPEETKVEPTKADKDSQSIEIPLAGQEQMCKQYNIAELEKSNHLSVDESLELASKIADADSSLKVDIGVDLPITVKYSAIIKEIPDEDSYNQYISTSSCDTKSPSNTTCMQEESGKSLTCDICDSKFTGKYNFVRHTMSHLNKASYICYICQKVYKLKQKLLNHMQKHSENKIFNCDKCHSTFRSRKNLNVHLQAFVHIDEKRYTCDICSARFVNKWFIQAHMKTHTVVKKLTCEQCPLLTFSDKSILMSHMKTHIPKSAHKRNVRKYLEAKNKTEKAAH